MFKITDYLEFDSKGRAICPCCASEGKKGKNLSLVPNTDGAYKCHRGCSSEQIRAALGVVKDTIVPTALAKPIQPIRSVTVTPQAIKEAHDVLMQSNGPARAWLRARGFTDEMLKHYRLGIGRAKAEKRHLPSINIPLPNDDGTQYWQKKRVAPWLPKEEQPEGYKAWSQYGIPARVFTTHQPDHPTQTWLCEGEWDAMYLGWLVRGSDLKNHIQVATFTAGSGNVPPQSELEKLQGDVIVFYDRDEAGEKGAAKVAAALTSRCKITTVPHPDNAPTGWDVSDALNNGYDLDAFTEAATNAIQPTPTKGKENPLRSRLLTTDELIARAPDYQEWLIPDLLTNNELFGLAAPPRAGKSLLCMLIAKAVATGQKFLDRPVTQGSVIYVNMEDSDVKIRERAEAQNWGQGLPVYWLDKFKMHELPHLIEIADGMEDLRLIILDTLSRVRSDDKTENSAEMSQVLEPLQEFAKSRNVCVLLVHHTTKINPDKNSLDEIFDMVRGNTAIRGTCRGLMLIAPGDNCYRLAIENGWGKHDLKIRLDASTLEWKLLGKWQPANVTPDQRTAVLDCLNRIGSASIDQIAAETSLPKRSLYTVLDRLVADELVIKQGSRQSAVYTRPIQQIQQLNSLLNSPNPDTESNRGSIQQKNNSSFSGNTSESDQSGTSDNLITFAADDHFFEGGAVVELTGTNACNVEPVNVSAIQQQFNNNSTVELDEPQSDRIGTSASPFKKGDAVVVYVPSKMDLRQARWGQIVSRNQASAVAITDLKLHDGYRVQFVDGDIKPVAECDLMSADAFNRLVGKGGHHG